MKRDLSFYGSLAAFVGGDGNLGICSTEALLGIDLAKESHLIVVSYFQCGSVFKSISIPERKEIIGKWLETTNEEALSILALLVNQLFPKSTHSDYKESCFEVIKDRISDPDWFENYEQAIEIHLALRD